MVMASKKSGIVGNTSIDVLLIVYGVEFIEMFDPSFDLYFCNNNNK